MSITHSMQLSFSHVYTYKVCPKRYHYRFVEGVPEGLSQSASLGTSMHNALYRFVQAMWGDRLWKTLEEPLKAQVTLFEEPTPQVPPLPKLLEMLDEAWIKAGYADAAAMYAAKEKAIALLRHWYAHHSEELRHTVAVELPFKYPLDGFVLSGRFDRIDKQGDDYFVVDYKSGMLRSQESVDGDLQLGLYALVLQEKLSLDRVRLALYFLKDDVQRETVRDRQSSVATKATIFAAGESIKRGEWSATPSEAACTYCPYKRICPERDPNVLP